MKKAKQIHTRQDQLTPEQTVQFLEDFRNLMSAKDKPTKLISLRVPENVLNAFKVKARLEGKKYQSVIVQLMREWVK